VFLLTTAQHLPIKPLERNRVNHIADKYNVQKFMPYLPIMHTLVGLADSNCLAMTEV